MCDENEEEYQDIDDIQETNENSNLIVFSRDWTVATIFYLLDEYQIKVH